MDFICGGEGCVMSWKIGAHVNKIQEHIESHGGANIFVEIEGNRYEVPESFWIKTPKSKEERKSELKKLLGIVNPQNDSAESSADFSMQDADNSDSGREGDSTHHISDLGDDRTTSADGSSNSNSKPNEFHPFANEFQKIITAFLIQHDCSVSFVDSLFTLLRHQSDDMKSKLAGYGGFSAAKQKLLSTFPTAATMRKILLNELEAQHQIRNPHSPPLQLMFRDCEAVAEQLLLGLDINEIVTKPIDMSVDIDDGKNGVRTEKIFGCFSSANYMKELCGASETPSIVFGFFLDKLQPFRMSDCTLFPLMMCILNTSSPVITHRLMSQVGYLPTLHKREKEDWEKKGGRKTKQAKKTTTNPTEKFDTSNLPAVALQVALCHILETLRIGKTKTWKVKGGVEFQATIRLGGFMGDLGDLFNVAAIGNAASLYACIYCLTLTHRELSSELLFPTFEYRDQEKYHQWWEELLEAIKAEADVVPILKKYHQERRKPIFCITQTEELRAANFKLHVHGLFSDSLHDVWEGLVPKLIRLLPLHLQLCLGADFQLAIVRLNNTLAQNATSLPSGMRRVYSLWQLVKLSNGQAPCIPGYQWRHALQQIVLALPVMGVEVAPIVKGLMLFIQMQRAIRATIFSASMVEEFRILARETVAALYDRSVFKHFSPTLKSHIVFTHYADMLLDRGAKCGQDGDIGESKLQDVKSDAYHTSKQAASMLDQMATRSALKLGLQWQQQQRGDVEKKLDVGVSELSGLFTSHVKNVCLHPFTAAAAGKLYKTDREKSSILLHKYHNDILNSQIYQQHFTHFEFSIKIFLHNHYSAMHERLRLRGLSADGQLPEIKAKPLVFTDFPPCPDSIRLWRTLKARRAPLWKQNVTQVNGDKGIIEREETKDLKISVSLNGNPADVLVSTDNKKDGFFFMRIFCFFSLPIKKVTNNGSIVGIDKQMAFGQWYEQITDDKNNCVLRKEKQCPKGKDCKYCPLLPPNVIQVRRLCVGKSYEDKKKRDKVVGVGEAYDVIPVSSILESCRIVHDCVHNQEDRYWLDLAYNWIEERDPVTMLPLQPLSEERILAAKYPERTKEDEELIAKILKREQSSKKKRQNVSKEKTDGRKKTRSTTATAATTAAAAVEEARRATTGGNTAAAPPPTGDKLHATMEMRSTSILLRTRSTATVASPHRDGDGNNKKSYDADADDDEEDDDDELSDEELDDDDPVYLPPNLETELRKLYKSTRHNSNEKKDSVDDDGSWSSDSDTAEDADAVGMNSPDDPDGDTDVDQQHASSGEDTREVLRCSRQRRATIGEE